MLTRQKIISAKRARRSSPRCARSESTSVEKYTREKVNHHGRGAYIQYYVRVEPCPSDRASTAGTCAGGAARARRGAVGTRRPVRQSAEAEKAGGRGSRPPPPRACRAPPPTPPVCAADRPDSHPLPPPISEGNARVDGARAAVRPATSVDRSGPHGPSFSRKARGRALLFKLPYAPN
jgi:hypothetical protein